MALQFHHILSGVRSRSLHEHKDNLVNHRPGARVDHMAMVDRMTCKLAGVSTERGHEDVGSPLQGVRPTQADNPDAPLPRRGGNRGNGVLEGIARFDSAHRSSFPAPTESPSPRFIRYWCPIWRTLFTSQYRTSPDGIPQKMKVNITGMR